MAIPTTYDPLAQLLLASRLTRRQIEWFWPCRLPLGNIAMLDGDPWDT